jgi:Cu(I)/Ag(I) efflux system membrane protein CusA/SilA
VKFALQTVPGVAEVASFEVLKTISIGFRSLKMQYYNVSMMEVMKAVKTSNMMVGANLK